jgi:hypothetical protein
MRTSMLLAGLLALAGSASSAQAAETLRTHSGIGGLGFVYPAASSADPFFSQMIEAVAEVRDTKCSRSEAFVWRPSDQKARESVFAETMYAFKITGYRLKPIDLTVPRVIAYEAQSRDNTSEDRRLLVGWVVNPSTVDLVLCRLREEEQ